MSLPRLDETRTGESPTDPPADLRTPAASADVRPALMKSTHRLVQASRANRHQPHALNHLVPKGGRCHRH